MGELTDIPTAVAEQGIDEVRTEVKKAKKVRFTPKEHQFLKGVVTEVIPGKINPKTGKPTTKRDVALKVYETKDPDVASAIASENLSKPKFQAVLAETFKKAGITPESMADVLREAMNAKKSASVQGMVFESDVADHSVRVTAVKAAASLMGVADDDGDGKSSVNFNFGNQVFVKKVENNVSN